MRVQRSLLLRGVMLPVKSVIFLHQEADEGSNDCGQHFGGRGVYVEHFYKHFQADVSEQKIDGVDESVPHHLPKGVYLGASKGNVLGQAEAEQECNGGD